MEEGGGREIELQTPTLHIIHKSDVRDKSDLNKVKMIKLLKENIRTYPCDFRVGKNLIDRAHRKY